MNSTHAVTEFVEKLFVGSQTVEETNSGRSARSNVGLGPFLRLDVELWFNITLQQQHINKHNVAA